MNKRAKKTSDKTNSHKQQKIISMFDQIAPTYDLVNRLLSAGIDVRWRKKGCQKALDTLSTNKISQIIDVACGTGDMLIHWQNQTKSQGINVSKYVGIDPSEGMLQIARKRVGFASLIKGQAQKLPIKPKSCDIVSISYGIRNVVDREKAFQEFNRVLKPDGIVLILEFTKRSGNGPIKTLVNAYMRHIMPVIGGIVAKDRSAYRYLPDSIDNFLTTDKLKQELVSNGFKITYAKTYSFGVSTLIIAQKTK